MDSERPLRLRDIAGRARLWSESMPGVLSRARVSGRIQTILGRDLSEGQLLNVAEGVVHQIGWYRSGCNTFDVTEGLTAALLLTNVPGLLWPSMAPPPFASFLVNIPAGYVPLKGRWLRYMWVTTGLREQSDGGATVEAMSALVSPEADCTLTGNLLFYFPVNDATRHVSLDVENYDHVRGCVRRLLVGLCHWLANDVHGDDVAARRVRRSADEAGGPVAAPRVVVVGRSVALPSAMRDAAKDLTHAAAKQPRPGWKLRFKHVVRGHWRNQPVGPGHADRRMTWIAPYWKGPEGADAWAHIYKP